MFRGLLLYCTLLVVVPAIAKDRLRRDLSGGKAVAPGLEDHAAYFSKNRQGISADNLAKADKLRLKTIASIRDLLTQKGPKQGRFELLLRLGELYIERHDYLRDIEMTIYAEAWDTWNANQRKSEKKPEPKVNFSGSEGELRKAADTFRQLATDFPRHPRTDAALFVLAQTLARLGSDTAVQYYKMIIKDHPKSQLLPDTYLALGEYYFDKHKIPEAIDFYQKVTAYKNHRAYLYAIYKLGWANYNAPQTNEQDARDNYKKAVSAFKVVIKLSSDREKNIKSNVDLRQEAIRDLVMVWAEAEDVDSAWKYFRAIGEKSAFYKMLERLGGIYYDQGKNEKAIVVFKRLLEEAPTRASNPEVHLKLVELNDLTGNISGVVAELRKMQRLYLGDTLWTRANKQSSKSDLIMSASSMMEKSLHRYGAVFHQRGQKTKIESYFAASSIIYSMYLESFPKGESAYDIRYYLAEILFDSKKFEEASRNYLVVAKQDSGGKYFKPAALNAVASLHELVKSKSYPKLPPVGQVSKPLPLPREKKLLVDSMESYLTLLPREKEADNMRFEIAQIYLDYGHYSEAIKRFEKLTRDFPETKQAKAAVKIIMAFYADRGEWNKLIHSGKSFVERKDNLLDTNLREYVVELLRGAMFKRALAFEKDQKFDRAARSFLDYQKTFPADSSADRALYNASLNFYKAGAIDQALSTGQLMVEKYPHSESLPHVLSDMASTFEVLAKFDEAATLYKRLGVSFPGDARAPEALYNAAILYKGLKKYDDSIAALLAFVKNFKNSRLASDAAMQLAELYERTGRTESAIRVYEDAVRNFSTNSEQAILAAAKAAVLKTFYGNRAQGVAEIERVRLALSAKDAPIAFQAREVIGSVLFKLAEPFFADFVAFKINDGLQIEKQVKEKQKRLVNLSELYERIVDVGSGEFTVASAYRLGEAHENFANGLLRAPMPKAATQADIDKMKTELEKVAFPLKEEAYKYFELAHKRSAEVQTFTAWTRRTYQKMVELAPEKNPEVNEISAEPAYLSHVLKGEASAMAEVIAN